jgi:hypothetical protein
MAVWEFPGLDLDFLFVLICDEEEHLWRFINRMLFLST